MQLVTMLSPNGETEIQANPIRVDYLKANGWTEKTAKSKPSKAEMKGDK